MMYARGKRVFMFMPKIEMISSSRCSIMIIAIIIGSVCRNCYNVMCAENWTTSSFHSIYTLIIQHCNTIQIQHITAT